jgi:hypothetical protein
MSWKWCKHIIFCFLFKLVHTVNLVSKQESSPTYFVFCPNHTWAEMYPSWIYCSSCPNYLPLDLHLSPFYRHFRRAIFQISSMFIHNLAPRTSARLALAQREHDEIHRPNLFLPKCAQPRSEFVTQIYEPTKSTHTSMLITCITSQNATHPTCLVRSSRIDRRKYRSPWPTPDTTTTMPRIQLIMRGDVMTSSRVISP